MRSSLRGNRPSRYFNPTRCMCVYTLSCLRAELSTLAIGTVQNLAKYRGNFEFCKILDCTAGICVARCAPREVARSRCHFTDLKIEVSLFKMPEERVFYNLSTLRYGFVKISKISSFQSASLIFFRSVHTNCKCIILCFYLFT